MGRLILEIPEKKIKEKWEISSYEDIDYILKKIKAMLYVKENYHKVKNSIEVEEIEEENL